MNSLRTSFERKKTKQSCYKQCEKENAFDNILTTNSSRVNSFVTEYIVCMYRLIQSK